MTPREFRRLFREFDAPSWQPWASVEDSVFGERPDDVALVRRLAGGRPLPTRPVREFWAICGRGSGKSRTAARLAVYMATGRAWARAPGEQIHVHVIGPDKRQAAITLGYVKGLFLSVPALARLIVREVRDGLELSNGVVIEVGTADPATERGFAFGVVIIEEAAQLPQDTSATPDSELVRAVRPGLARVPGSLLCVIGSPYAQRGELWRTWREKFGTDDPDVLVVQGPTLVLNPAFDAREVERAQRDDPVSAQCEYGAQFLSGVGSLFDDAALAACVVGGVRERAPGASAGVRTGHVDASTGSGEDAWAAAVAETRGEGAALLAVRTWRPPFNPSVVAGECAEFFRSYHVVEVTRDQFAGGLVDDLMRRHGVDVRPAAMDTSSAYLQLVAAVNCGRVELLDHPALLRELRGLERRRGAAGKDRVTHPLRGHDDLAAASAFALVGALAEAEVDEDLLLFTPRRLARLAEQQRAEREAAVQRPEAPAEEPETAGALLGVDGAEDSMNGPLGRIRAAALAGWRALRSGEPDPSQVPAEPRANEPAEPDAARLRRIGATFESQVRRTGSYFPGD